MDSLQPSRSHSVVTFPVQDDLLDFLDRYMILPGVDLASLPQLYHMARDIYQLRC